MRTSSLPKASSAAYLSYGNPSLREAERGVTLQPPSTHTPSTQSHKKATTLRGAPRKWKHASPGALRPGRSSSAACSAARGTARRGSRRPPALPGARTPPLTNGSTPAPLLALGAPPRPRGVRAAAARATAPGPRKRPGGRAVPPLGRESVGGQRGRGR